jgi:hypothetical protein
MDPTDKEIEAIDMEIRLMRKLQAPRKVIDSLKNQDGRHWDGDKDGNRTTIDFLLHDW